MGLYDVEPSPKPHAVSSQFLCQVYQFSISEQLSFRIVVVNARAPVRRLGNLHTYFCLSRRMYETHFKKWGLAKNLKLSEKTQAICQILKEAHSSQSPTLKLSGEQYRKLIRHTKLVQKQTMSADKSRPPQKSLLSINTKTPFTQATETDALINRPDEESQLPRTLITNEHYMNALLQTASSSQNPLLIPESSPTTTLLSYIGEGASGLDPSLINRDSNSPWALVDLLSPPETTCLEIVLRSVHDLCTSDRIYEHSGEPFGLQSLSIQSSGSSPPGLERGNFWNELSCTIYLLKISQPARAMSALSTALHMAETSLRSSPYLFAMELFSVLSPVNTVVCKGLRTDLLRLLNSLSRSHLGEKHPLTSLTQELQNDRSSGEISVRGLSSMIGLLSLGLQLSDKSICRAQRMLIKLHRRSGRRTEALSIARKLADKLASSHGKDSIQARLAMREVEHVLMDMGEWQQALELCMVIVGQAGPFEGVPEPQCLDDCAAYTMEDIAKIYDNLKDTGSSIKWLEKAVQCEWDLWKDSVATKHTVDKLVAALSRCGRNGEAMVWQEMYLSEL